MIRSNTWKYGLLVAWSLSCGRITSHAQSTAVSSIAPPSTVYELQPLGEKPEQDKTKPLINWLPVWGKGAADKGFDLPLPMGVGVTYT